MAGRALAAEAFLAREPSRQKTAATCMQKTWRGRTLRRRQFRLAQVEAEATRVKAEVEGRRAATTIQARTRGKPLGCTLLQSTPLPLLPPPSLKYMCIPPSCTIFLLGCVLPGTRG